MAAFEVGRQEFPSMRKHLRGAIPKLPEPTIDWIHDRVERDNKVAGCPNDLWLIHGNLYDLTTFLDAHPGGPEWLEFTRGTDCTTEFETHHLDEAKAKAILKKYYVRPCKDAAKVAAYTFEENGFYKSFKRAAFEKLKTTGWGPSKEMIFYCATAVIAYLLSYVYLLKSMSLFSAIVSGLAIYPLYGVGHNFFHMRNTLWRYAFDLTCLSHHDWRISHAISHHHFPSFVTQQNLHSDIEVSFVEPYLRFFRSQKPNLSGVVIIWFVFTMLLAPFEYVRRTMGIVSGKDKFRPEFAIPLVMLSGALLAGGVWGVLLYVLSQAVSVILFVAISTPVHRTEYAWTPGCESVRAPRADYGEQTVIATNDFHVEEGPLFVKLFFFTSFSDHITHHLFPTIDLSKQHLLRTLFLEHCQKFNVPYRKTYYFDMLRSVFTLLRRKDGELRYKPVET